MATLQADKTKTATTHNLYNLNIAMTRRTVADTLCFGCSDCCCSMKSNT